MKISSVRVVSTLVLVTFWLLFALSMGDKPVEAEVMESASVTLTVYDANNLPANNVKVVLSSVNLQVPVTIRANYSGVAKIEGLLPGSYHMVISANNKDPVILSDVQVSGNYAQMVHMINSNTAFIQNLTYADNSYWTPTEFNGFVTFYVGNPGAGTSANVAFYNDQDEMIGSPFMSNLPVNYNLYNSITIPATSLPAGATRIGIELVNNNNFVDNQTKKLWKQPFFEPVAAQFIDNNPYGDAIDGLLKWSGATDETGIAGYTVFYVIKNDDYSEEEHYLGSFAKREDKSYQIAIPTLPEDAAILVIKAVVNPSGEEVGFPKQVIVFDNSLSDSVTSVTYSSSLPTPSFFNSYFNYTHPTTIRGSLGWDVGTSSETIKGHAIYFADAAGNKIQPIRSIRLPKRWNINFTDFPEDIAVPTGAKKVAVYAVSSQGVESLPVYYTLPVKYPTVKAANSNFIDWDASDELRHGYLTWSNPPNSSTVSGYAVYANGGSAGKHLIGKVPKAAAMAIAVSQETVSGGSTELLVYAYQTNSGEDYEAVEYVSVPLTNNSTTAQVEAQLESTYFQGVSSINISHVVSVITSSLKPIRQEDVKQLLKLISPIQAP
ncbi:hypothetical protein LOZ80_27755 [Paenibacillus sp. HWE-109]|uniref:carboxypeptidase-like regulatory domain-containing protein n=1 Tax=Paenibacillus sp. HWE-109 TaxID=1306526 RepID=UPI001EDFB49F|nr:carboxypeptidase-like regulatory domain-containing protein [Paenibacillus sp. HWE-109]UKS25364.1 hypothetical protein LOZ80_27755 [Paenibacillus sp. HWE-109]